MRKRNLSAATICLIAVLSATGCNKKSATMQTSASVSSASNASSDATLPDTAKSVTTSAALSPPPFDIESVVRTTVSLPPFPYVDYPASLDKSYHGGLPPTPFDAAVVIAGSELKPLEGKVSVRYFPNNPANLSVTAAQRNYENAIKALGGVKVNHVMPTDPALIAKQPGGIEALFGKLRINDSPRAADHGVSVYDQYLIRSDKANIWIAVIEENGGLTTKLVTVEEKAMEQSVSQIKADAMAASLQTQGHIALYLSFDTDSDAIKRDSTPVVDEIVKLLRTDSQLRLNIEGHTDNLGSVAHNKALSLARAQAVVKAITVQGIDSARLNATGLGAERPLQDNATETGRAKNRRVELVKL